MKRLIIFSLLAAADLLSIKNASAHSTGEGSAGEGGSRLLDAFTHWPPSARDAHYYLETLFVLLFIVLLTVQIIQNRKKKKEQK